MEYEVHRIQTGTTGISSLFQCLQSCEVKFTGKSIDTDSSMTIKCHPAGPREPGQDEADF